MIENLTQTLKFAGCAGVATGSILVYAYILIYCFKELGFENEGFEVERVFRPPTTTFEGRQDKRIYRHEDTKARSTCCYFFWAGIKKAHY